MQRPKPTDQSREGRISLPELTSSRKFKSENLTKIFTGVLLYFNGFKRESNKLGLAGKLHSLALQPAQEH